MWVAANADPLRNDLAMFSDHDSSKLNFAYDASGNLLAMLGNLYDSSNGSSHFWFSPNHLTPGLHPIEFDQLKTTAWPFHINSQRWASETALIAAAKQFKTKGSTEKGIVFDGQAFYFRLSNQEWSRFYGTNEPPRGLNVNVSREAFTRMYPGFSSLQDANEFPKSVKDSLAKLYEDAAKLQKALSIYEQKTTTNNSTL